MRNKVDRKAIRCTCGRTTHDHADLAVVNRFSSELHNLTRNSRVRCLREGCEGTWLSDARYIDTLPDFFKE